MGIFWTIAECAVTTERDAWSDKSEDECFDFSGREASPSHVRYRERLNDF